ncbi:MAG: hypothetical protein MK211_03290 [Flavobacteriales bacterium]|nr:hypothetical protein [Flavobacteriales bacterium]
MKLLSKTLLLLFFVPGIVLAHNGEPKGKYTKEKKINKEYKVNANAGLRVDNSYGNIDIVTWNENRTVIEVTITTNGDDEEKVQQKLDEITVEFTANASLVTAKTIFDDTKNSWKIWNSKKNSVSMSIHYRIKLPVTNTVDLDNDYGAINLNRLEGNAKINCDYGQLIIGELLADNNLLSFDYTQNSTIAYMKSGTIKADYSGFSLEKIDDLELAADYTDSKIGEVNNLNYNNDYGKIAIDKVGNLVGRGDYIPNRIGTVTGSLNLNTDYGSIVINKVASTANNVTIKSDYTAVKLGYEAGYSFDFIIKLSFANFKGGNDVTVTNSDKGYTSKNYQGYHNIRNSGNNLNINSSYGSVSLTKL